MSAGGLAGFDGIDGLLVDAHREIVLRPDLPPVNDPDRDRELRVWVRRLGDAVLAGILTRTDAETALRSEVSRDCRA